MPAKLIPGMRNISTKKRMVAKIISSTMVRMVMFFLGFEFEVTYLFGQCQAFCFHLLDLVFECQDGVS